MSKNRRFPFERAREPISLEGLSIAEDQLYPVVRQYAAVYRLTNEQPRYVTAEATVDENNTQLDDFVKVLKQESDQSVVNQNDFSALREHDIRRWKHVNQRWQKYYREEIRKQQTIFDELIRSSRR